MPHRRERVGDQIRAELSRLLLRNLRDPRIGFATVTEVRMSGDLRSARVYVSVLGTPSQRQATLAALNAAGGFLRGEIGRSLKLRYAPELRFQPDLSLEQGSRIEELLEGVPSGREKLDGDDEE